jgi:L-asparagine transporter-like permease
MPTTRMTNYDRRMVRLMNDRRGRPLYATAARRRLAVAVHITLTAAFGALMAHLYLAEPEPMWAIVVMAVLLLPWMIATGAINAATRGLLELRERALDERQSAERSRVLARAHRVMTLLLVMAAAGLLIAGAADGDAPKAYAAPVLIAALVAHWLMPLWVAGLMAQDEPAEDEALAVQPG